MQDHWPLVSAPLSLTGTRHHLAALILYSLDLLYTARGGAHNWVRPPKWLTTAVHFHPALVASGSPWLATAVLMPGRPLTV